MQSSSSSITQLLGQLYDAAQSTGGWPAVLAELDIQRLVDGGGSIDTVQLRRAMETERSMRRFGATVSPASVFDIGPLAQKPQGREMMEALAPHVTHAHRLHGTLEAGRAERAMLAEAAGKAQLAVVMLNAHGEVVQMTSSARTVLAEDDGLVLRGKRLRATVSTEHPEFSALLSEAAHAAMNAAAPTNERHEEPSAIAGEGAMLMTRRSPRHPLQVIVTPMRSTDLPVTMQGSVLVFLCDPQAVPSSRASILRKLYGLSPTEGRLVDELAAGIELQLAAKRMRLTVHTARFHLKSIFRKTAVNRQSDLVRLVLGLPGRGD
jgi:DNA-binding CsgD family transcriptional regulator